jgi:Arc/MetJ-type ribon-helix-helix transcriptional regulator
VEGLRIEIGSIGPHQRVNLGINPYAIENLKIAQRSIELAREDRLKVDGPLGVVVKPYPQNMRALDTERLYKMNGMCHRTRHFVRISFMQLQLKNRELENFLTEQVKAGHFASPEAAVEAAVEQMKLDQSSVELTTADLDAIKESDGQIDRGESVDFDTFEGEMRRKYGGK